MTTDLRTARLDCGLVVIHRQTLVNIEDTEAYLAACRELEAAVAGQEYSLLVRFWYFGISPTAPDQVTHVLGLTSPASDGPWIKSKPWKHFLKSTGPLVKTPGPGNSEVKVLTDVAGLAVLSH